MISLIIPFYNVSDELVETTKRCIDSLKYEMPGELILVDDASPVYHYFGAYPTIVNRENRGYTYSVNRGLEAAHGDILVVGNNDLTFTPEWLTGLVRTLEMGYDIAVIPTSDQTYETKDEITEKEKFGSLFAMTRKTYQTLGLFDEQFRGYYVDTDYRRRAINAGLKIGKNWKYLVEHEARATYSVVDSKNDEFNTATELYKAKWGCVE